MPLMSLDRACPQAEPTSSFEEDSTTYTHTRLINQSSATLTDPTLGLHSGPAQEAGLSVDA